jgi:aspartate kinase
LSSTIVAAAFAEYGLPAEWVDPRRVMVTDDRFGDAEPDGDAVAARAREWLWPLLRDDRIPVVGGFVGATPEGETTTLGRGGSDTSAAVFGAAMDAEEIQLWTDVDGLMSADPGLVPEARPIDRLTFVEATELAFYGARVLHPNCLAPAVSRGIPVRVLNSMAPARRGTVIVDRVDEESEAPVVSVASRAGVRSLSVVNRRKMRADAGFAAGVLDVLRDRGLPPDLVVASELGIHLVVDRRAEEPEALVSALGRFGDVRLHDGRAVICVVGSRLAAPVERGRALAALAEWQPELLALGSTGASLAAVVPEERLAPAVRGLHRRYLEEID